MRPHKRGLPSTSGPFPLNLSRYALQEHSQWQKSRSSVSASWAIPMAGHLKTQGGHDVTVYNRTAAKARELGCRIRRHVAAATPAEAADGQPISSSPASAMTTTCARSRSARTALCEGMKKGAVLHRQHHRHRPKSPASFMKPPTAGRLRFHRRAGFRRPGRRGKRRAHRHVRRRRRRLRTGQARSSTPMPAWSARWALPAPAS